MDDGRATGGVYEFSGFRLAAAQRRLTSRTDGRPIELTPKAFDALLYLVRHPGELLDKATLLQAIWPNVVVEENNLNQVISALRRALDGGDERRLIVTVPGRGYQFVAAVTQATGTRTPELPADMPEPAPAPAATPTPTPTAVPSPGNRASIAVLPFASFSSDPEKDYFGDGIAEELIHLLARVPGLKVPARTSSFAYKGRNVDVRQIARDLGVSMLLEGSVRSAGERIRVTAQLVEADTGFHVWSQTYDRQFADVFQLQDELAGAIVQALRISLGGERTAPLRQEPPTKDVEAYRLYLQSRAIWFGGAGTRADWGKAALALLERSLEHDRSFARAYAMLGAIQNFQFSLGVQGPEILFEAQRSVEHALALDPDLADAHALLGALRGTRGQWVAAEASFQRAIALDPAEALTRASFALFVLGPVGKMQQAFEQSSEGFRLAPATPGTTINLAGFCSLTGRDAEAARYARMAVDLGFGEQQVPLPILRSQVARAAGRYAEAADHMLHTIPAAILEQGRDVVRLVFGALGDARQTSKAITALRALNRTGDAAVMEAWPMIMLSLNWYAMLGALDDAFQIGERMLAVFERTGILNAVNLSPLWLPELRAFRLDPRFGDFTRRLGLIDYWKQQGPPDQGALQDGRLVLG